MSIRKHEHPKTSHHSQWFIFNRNTVLWFLTGSTPRFIFEHTTLNCKLGFLFLCLNEFAQQNKVTLQKRLKWVFLSSFQSKIKCSKKNKLYSLKNLILPKISSYSRATRLHQSVMIEEIVKRTICTHFYSKYLNDPDWNVSV